MAAALARWPMTRNVGRKLLVGRRRVRRCMVVFGLSTSFLLSLLVLAISGAADMVSVIVRQTLVQIETPDAMRGRVAAVNTLFIGASNQLGEFESGATAALMGPVGSVVAGGIGTLVVAGLWMRYFGALVRRDRFQQAVARLGRLAALPLGAEHLLQLERGGDFQLVVAAVLRRLVVAPAQEGGGVAEAVALQVVVLDLDHALGPQRLPAQVLAAAPARLRAGHALASPTLAWAHSRQGWSAIAFSRSGASSSARMRRVASVNDEVTPTCCSTPPSSYRPSSSEPTASCVSLYQRKPATTQSAVRACLILNMVRLPGW
jgi:hypothetical protein